MTLKWNHAKNYVRMELCMKCGKDGITYEMML